MNLDELIKNHGPHAVEERLAEHASWDRVAVEAIHDRRAVERNAKVCTWLGNYRVFMGFDGPARDRITKVILEWSDAQPASAKLESAESIAHAQQDLMQRSQRAFGATRNFTSLASKALWLRFPTVVPMFDRNSRQTLTVLSKFDGVSIKPDLKLSEYHQFLIVWMSFFNRHQKVLQAIPLKGYPYLCRVFDQILWDIGSPNYNSLMDQTDAQ